MIVVGGFNSAIDVLAEADAIAIGGVARLRNVRREAGGKGLHVAVACAMLNAPATLVGLIDAASRPLFDDTLTRIGVRFVGVPIDQPVRTCWAIRDAAARVTELLEPGPLLSTERAVTLAAAFMREATAARCVVLSGSLPNGVASDTYARLIGALDASRVLLDTSGVPLAEGLAAAPFVVKPNRDEAAHIAGFPIASHDDAVRAAARIAARGPRIVALSLGSEGAIMFERDSGVAWSLEAPRVEARNPVGAGDCFLGAFAAGLLRGDSLEDCARSAVACGTAKARHPDTGAFHLSDVEALRPRVTVTRVPVHA